MAMTGPNISRAADQRGLYRGQPFLDMAVDILHHDDGVVDHKPDRQHHRQQGQ